MPRGKTKKPTCSELRSRLLAAGLEVHSRASKADLEAMVQQHLSQQDGVDNAADDDGDSDDGAEDETDLMAAFDEENDIVEALRLLKQGYIEAVTRKGYQNMQKKLYVWIHEKQLNGKHKQIKLQMSEGGAPIGIEGVVVKIKVQRGEEEVEVEELADLTKFPISVFMEFIISLKSTKLFDTKTGKAMLIGRGGLAGYRKAFTNLFVEKGLQQPPEMVQELKVYFAALKRQDAREKAAGSRPVTEGKEAIPYPVYVRICNEFLKAGQFFELLYSTLCWNLMCRTENTAMITIEHLVMISDAIGVKFSQQKCDKTGEELASHFRRIYSGKGVVSVGVALALYLMTTPSLGDDGKALFPGTAGSQKKRFSASLDKLLEREDMQTFLLSYGLTAQSFGSHSFRKGAATFATSGCTGGPSLVSVCIRAGWAVGGVLDRYIKFDARGDAFLGRVLAGFDLSSADFGAATPHFKAPVDKDMLHAIFPILNQHPKFTAIAMHALACFVCAEERIKELLPADTEAARKIFKTRLYREPGDFNKLKEAVSVEVEADVLITGVPEFTHMLTMLLKVVKQMEDLPGRLCVDLGQVMEDKGAAAGNVTEARVKQLLEEQQVRILAGVKGIVTSSNAVAAEAQQVPAVLDAGNMYKGYMWAKKNDKQQRFHLLPHGHKLDAEKTCAMRVWERWWCRFADKSSAGYFLPPIRRLMREDFSDSNQGKRFGEWKCVLEELEAEVKREDATLFADMERAFCQVPTAVSDNQIQRSWLLCKARVIDMIGRGRKKAPKRTSQTSFSTVVWHRMGGHHKAKKRKTAADGGSEGGSDGGRGGRE